MSNKIGILAVISVFSTGCATSPPGSAYLGAKANPSDTHTTLEINTEVERTLQVCYDLFGAKSQKADERSWNANMIAIGGLVAGSVIAPALVAANAAANATWIAAFSGAAGASAITVKNLDSSGLSGSHDILMLNALATKIHDDLATAYNVSNLEKDRLQGAANARSYCQVPFLQPRSLGET